MYTCANCVRKATYTYAVTPGKLPTPYCSRHLPSFTRKLPNSLRLVKIISAPEAVAEVEEEVAPKPAPRKKTQEVESVEEPLIETPEETAPEEPEKEGESSDG